MINAIEFIAKQFMHIFIVHEQMRMSTFVIMSDCECDSVASIVLQDSSNGFGVVATIIFVSAFLFTFA